MVIYCDKMISAYSDSDIGMFNFHLPNNKGICVGHSLKSVVSAQSETDEVSGGCSVLGFFWHSLH